MELMLFLGSGVSFAFGLPDVSKITTSLLDEEWHSCSDRTFGYGGEPNPHPIYQSSNIAPRLQKFLKILKESCDKYLSKRRQRESTYEDLFYICQQITDNYNFEIDNPLIVPFIAQLKKQTKELCTPVPVLGREIDLATLASESCDLIQCVVWYAFYNREKPKGLDLVIELTRNKKLEELIIATLNHDLLIEQLMFDNDIEYVDGFGMPDGDVRFFEPGLYDKCYSKVKLFKLHGSINWYRFRKHENGATIDKYGCAASLDHQHCRNSKGQLFSNLDSVPTFLTGSYNKMSDYGFGIFAKVHHKFFDELFRQDIIIMSGYGWNDRGINGRLFEWLLSSHQKRLILLHNNPELEIKSKSKSAMWHRYDKLVEDGRLVPIKNWLSETSIEDIAEAIPKLAT